MNSDDPKLGRLLTEWQEWSHTTDQAEDGWEACFPEWPPLMDAAKKVMINHSLTDQEFRWLETCWRISQEDEPLVDYAKANLPACWQAITRLVASAHPEVRWQVYEVLGEAKGKGESLLRRGIRDTDCYCRRRALLSLAKLAPEDIKDVAAGLASDPDQYVRKVAKELFLER